MSSSSTVIIVLTNWTLCVCSCGISAVSLGSGACGSVTVEESAPSCKSWFLKLCLLPSKRVTRTSLLGPKMTEDINETAESQPSHASLSINSSLVFQSKRHVQH